MVFLRMAQRVQQKNHLKEIDLYLLIFPNSKDIYIRISLSRNVPITAIKQKKTNLPPLLIMKISPNGLNHQRNEALIYILFIFYLLFVITHKLHIHERRTSLSSMGI